MWPDVDKSGQLPPGRAFPRAGRRGVDHAAGNIGEMAAKVNTHTGDNPVSIYQEFIDPVACVLAGVRGVCSTG